MLELLIIFVVGVALVAPLATLAILEEKREIRKEKNDLFFKKIENFRF